MVRWIFYLVLLGLVAWGCRYAYGRVDTEMVCRYTSKCEDRLHSLDTQLEFYSSAQVIAQEKASGEVSERRAFYPPDLETLAKDQKGSEEFTTCPIYGVKYKYEPREGGKSFFAYCPARHRFHFEERPFVNAIVPDQINLHLFVDGGKTFNLVAEHPNPFDFKTPAHVPPVEGAAYDPKNPTYTEVPSKIAPDAFQMIPENPLPIARW